MKDFQSTQNLKRYAQLLRWNKPSGRLILLIPAGWALFLTPNSPPDLSLIGLIIAGGIFVSGAGCIANDLWDRKIDSQVSRTKFRPLAAGSIRLSTAWNLLILMLLLSLLTVLLLPSEGKVLCIILALIALPPILLYPSAKRWFSYPQALLAICWGFAVLIPWAAAQGDLSGGFPLLFCWAATLAWSFGFDTVYAMSDKDEDEQLGLKSSVLSLKGKANITVSISYLLAGIFLSSAVYISKTNWIFWPFMIIAVLAMRRELIILNSKSLTSYQKHFKNQVWIGSLILFGLIIGKIS